MAPFAAAADTGSRYFVTRTGPAAVNRAMEPLRVTGARAVANEAPAGGHRPVSAVTGLPVVGGLGVPGIPGDVR
ncbi:hypothetical protein [Nocardia fusca]|uniref:hypothetical protein n=1 Tax=Nocardia fusca TaxID=941183 RepID=UPI000A675A1E|nr:hypothetical protein [Nocardia fusca]